MAAIFDWATPDNIQPEPITIETWRELHEDFCRQVEVVDGAAVRCESPTRAHQKAARRLASMLETAAAEQMRADPDECFDVENDFDVVLWEVPRATIRRPDTALFRCAPPELRPLPAGHLVVVVEVVSRSHVKTDRLDKMAEYAAAGIPWYWLVTTDDTAVTGIELYALDYGKAAYGLNRHLQPTDGTVAVDLPLRITIDWSQLTHLVL